MFEGFSPPYFIPILIAQSSKDTVTAIHIHSSITHSGNFLK